VLFFMQVKAIPAKLGDLEHLEELFLSGNNLAQIPKELGEAPRNHPRTILESPP
jgi:Leucine-rich repeat (LRR) protein